MAELGQVDLHVHTTASDGVHAPREVIRLAKEAGLAGIAVTDHDTVAGVAEAMAAGEEAGLLVVPGVEISTSLAGKDIHVLGYFVDMHDPAFLARLERQRDTRGRRNAMILAKLAALGIPVMHAEVEAAADRLDGSGGARQGDRTASARSIGRPHIAQVLIDRGIVSSVQEAFDKYLGEGGAAHVVPPRIAPAEAVRWIREAGGKAVLAHPGLYGDDELVLRIVEDGVDGIEAFHHDHGPDEARRYAAMAERFGLPITAGSDFHGSREGVLLHGTIGARRISADILDKLRGRG